MFKTFSPGLQVVVFIFIAFFMASFGQLIYALSLSLVVDQSVLENINPQDPRIILSSAFFFQIFAFILSLILILKMIGQRFTDVIFVQSIKIKPLLITFGVFIGAMLMIPFLSAFNDLLRYIVPSAIIENDIATKAVNNSLIFDSNPIQLFFTLISAALLPAICEEFVFRGFLIKKMLESGLGKMGAILLSAAIFSLTHFQPLSFLPIFFFGICLGYIYLHFKNIKYAMFFHFCVNASQIIVGYFTGAGGIDFGI